MEQEMIMDGCRATSGGYGTMAITDEEPLIEVQPKSFSRFRYLVAMILILGAMIQIYEVYVLYVVAIRMVSSDVLDAGLTQIRRKYLNQDPLAPETSNAALEGTCPIEVANQFQTNQSSTVNLESASQSQQLAIALESLVFTAQVQSDLAQGRLVDWDISQRGFAFTCHSLGAMLGAIPNSRLGLTYGAKLMVAIALTSSTMHVLLFPTVASFAPFWVTLVFEITMGALSCGLKCVAYPLAGTWLLPSEAGAFVVLYHLGTLVGSTMSQYVSAQVVVPLGWPWCFYLPAFPLALITIGWIVLGADRPTMSRFISKWELDLLETSSLAKTKPADELSLDTAECKCSDRGACPARQVRRTPNWRKLVTCPIIWSLVLVHFAVCWNTSVSTLWPTYFANILHLKPSTIGNLELVRGVLAVLLGLFFAWLSLKLDFNRPFNMSLTKLRRLYQVMSACLLTTSNLLITYFDCNKYISMSSVLLIPFVSNLNIMSYLQIPLDLSTEDSGIIYSYMVTFSVGNLVALPVVTQILASGANPQVGSRDTWAIVWLLGLGIKIVACLFFATLARAEPKSYSHLRPAGPCKSAQAMASS